MSYVWRTMSCRISHVTYCMCYVRILDVRHHMYDVIRLYYTVSQDTISYLEHTISCIDIKTCSIRYCTSSFDLWYHRYGTYTGNVVCRKCLIQMSYVLYHDVWYRIFTYDIVCQATISYTTYEHTISYISISYIFYDIVLVQKKREKSHCLSRDVLW